MDGSATGASVRAAHRVALSLRRNVARSWRPSTGERRVFPTSPSKSSTTNLHHTRF